MVLHGIALHLMILHSPSCHCIVSYGVAWYCIVGFGARAVSRKTPTYFIYMGCKVLCKCLQTALHVALHCTRCPFSYHSALKTIRLFPIDKQPEAKLTVIRQIRLICQLFPKFQPQPYTKLLLSC